MVNISGAYGKLKTWVKSRIAEHKDNADAHHTKTISSDINIANTNDVDDTNKANDKILQYKTTSGKHEYVTQSGGTSGQGFKAMASIAQQIPTTAWATVVFDNEEFDTENDYNHLTGIYTPSIAGYYIITGNIVLESLAAGNKFVIALRKNGTTDQALDRGATGGATHCGGCVSSVIYLNGSSDYLEMRIYHDYGANRILKNNAGYNNFSGWLLPAP